MASCFRTGKTSTRPEQDYYGYSVHINELQGEFRKSCKRSGGKSRPSAADARKTRECIDKIAPVSLYFNAQRSDEKQAPGHQPNRQHRP